MNVDILAMYDQLASLGQAPVDGCSLFGVGLDDAISRLTAKYIDDGFKRGLSAEKFVLGPYGSGKTHFVNQTSEAARHLGCVTATVQLSKAIDYADSITVYREITQEVRVGDGMHGMRHLVPALLDRARSVLSGTPDEKAALDAWVEGIRDGDFVSQDLAVVMHRAMRAHLDAAADDFDAACRWLSGDFTDSSVAKGAGMTKRSAASAKVLANRARITLFQIIRHAQCPGTVLVFDEAEQGLAVNKARLASIFSQFMQELNALVSANYASALVIFALTPDVREKIAAMLPALEQRLRDPSPGEGFFDGNTRAPIIDLTTRRDLDTDLVAIGRRLVEVFAERGPGVNRPRIHALLGDVVGWAKQVASTNPGASARREMVKLVAGRILASHEGGTAASAHPPEPEV